MNKLIKWLAAGLMFGLPFSLFSEMNGLRPENFLLGDVFFQRPEAWLWVPVEESKPAHKFVIPDENGNETGSVIMFFHARQNGTNTTTAESIIPRWREQFAPQIFFEKTKHNVNGIDITFMRVEGTQRSSSSRAERRPDYGLCAAVAEMPTGTITVRVVGPRAMIAMAEKDMRQMMEASFAAD